MIGWLRDKTAQFALNMVKDKFVNPNLDGICTVSDIRYHDKALSLTLALDGLEDRPIEVTCSDFEIAPDCSTITIHKFESNMPFARNALNRFASGPISIPEGGARTAVCAAKKVLGL